MHNLRYYEMDGTLAILKAPERDDFKSKAEYTAARDKTVRTWAAKHREELMEISRRILKLRENLSNGRLKADQYSDERVFQYSLSGIFEAVDADAENGIPFVSLFAEIELYLFQYACLEAPCVLPSEFTD